MSTEYADVWNYLKVENANPAILQQLRLEIQKLEYETPFLDNPVFIEMSSNEFRVFAGTQNTTIESLLMKLTGQYPGSRINYSYSYKDGSGANLIIEQSQIIYTISRGAATTHKDYEKYAGRCACAAAHSIASNQPKPFPDCP